MFSHSRRCDILIFGAHTGTGTLLPGGGMGSGSHHLVVVPARRHNRQVATVGACPGFVFWGAPGAPSPLGVDAGPMPGGGPAGVQEPPSARAWLQALGVAQYADAFQAQEVDARCLALLTDDDLAHVLGVTDLHHRRTILAAARQGTGVAVSGRLLAYTIAYKCLQPETDFRSHCPAGQAMTTPALRCRTNEPLPLAPRGMRRVCFLSLLQTHLCIHFLKVLSSAQLL